MTLRGYQPQPPTHLYGAAGNYTAIVRVADDGELSDTESASITVTGGVWAHTWGGSAYDNGQGVAVDGCGNMYVTGTTRSFGAGGDDALLLKYDVGGNLLWQKAWGGSFWDNGLAVAVDGSGVVYVTGITHSFGAGWADIPLKYDDGDLLWQKTWGGEDWDYGCGLAVNGNGDVYVTGLTASFGAGIWDAYLLKFDAAGNLVWQRTWGGNSDDYGWDIAVDDTGLVYVTGETYSFGAGYNDLYLLKYNSSGDLLWQKTWSGEDWEDSFGVAVGRGGSVYVTGSTQSAGIGNADAILLKYDDSGNLLWQKTWSRSSDDFGRSVVVDDTGLVYVTGTTQNAGIGNADAFLLKYDDNGNLLWQKTWGGSGLSSGLNLALDSSGNVCICGEAQFPLAPGLKRAEQALRYPESKAPLSAVIVFLSALRARL